METSFPYDNKRSAWIALQRNGRMSLARPAAGGESCFAGFIFIVWETSFPYDNKRSTRMLTRARVDGCRGNRASARECAKAHSFLLYRKEEIDLKVHAPSYCVPEPCTGENRDQRDYNNATDGAYDRRPGQPQRK